MKEQRRLILGGSEGEAAQERARGAALQRKYDCCFRGWRARASAVLAHAATTRPPRPAPTRSLAPHLPTAEALGWRERSQNTLPTPVDSVTGTRPSTRVLLILSSVPSEWRERGAGGLVGRRARPRAQRAGLCLAGRGKRGRQAVAGVSAAATAGGAAAPSH